MSVQARQLAISEDSRLLFHPSGSVVQMFRLMDGLPIKVLRGHMDTINCCVWNAELQVSLESASCLQTASSLRDVSCHMVLRYRSSTAEVMMAT